MSVLIKISSDYHNIAGNISGILATIIGSTYIGLKIGGNVKKYKFGISPHLLLFVTCGCGVWSFNYLSLEASKIIEQIKYTSFKDHMMASMATVSFSMISTLLTIEAVKSFEKYSNEASEIDKE